MVPLQTDTSTLRKRSRWKIVFKKKEKKEEEAAKTVDRLVMVSEGELLREAFLA